MASAEPFDALSSFQPRASQPSPGFFDQADGHVWDESWSGELPQPCGAWEDDYYMHHHTVGNFAWPIHYQEASDSIEHAAWGGSRTESVNEAYPPYTSEALFPSQNFHHDPGPSSPGIYYYPSVPGSYDGWQPSPIPYPQPGTFLEPAFSTQSSSTSNSMGPRPSTEHQSTLPKRPKTTRTSPNKQTAHKKRDSVSTGTLDLEPDCDPPQNHTRTKERNRVAANKFRNQKREDFAKLKSDEETMEEQHRRLKKCVTQLTQEVYQLKLQLFKHSDCDCKLIQNYIQTEAHRYMFSLICAKGV